MSQAKKTLKIIFAGAISLILNACVVTDKDYLACTSALHREIMKSQSDIYKRDKSNKFDRYTPYSSRQYPRIESHHFHKDNTHSLNSNTFHLDERFQPRLPMPVSPSKKSHLNSIDQKTHTKVQSNNKVFHDNQHGQTVQRPVQHRSFKNSDVLPERHTYTRNHESSNSNRTKRHDVHEPLNQQAFVAKRPVQHEVIKRAKDF